MAPWIPVGRNPAVVTEAGSKDSLKEVWNVTWEAEVDSVDGWNLVIVLIWGAIRSIV